MGNNPVTKKDPEGYQTNKTGDAIGKIPSVINEYLSIFADLNRLSNIVNAYNDYSKQIPEGEEQNVVIYIDDITGEVITVVPEGQEVLLPQETSGLPMKVEGKKKKVKIDPPETKAPSQFPPPDLPEVDSDKEDNVVPVPYVPYQDLKTGHCRVLI